MTEDISLHVSQVPDEDATDWERAMLVAEDLYRTDAVGKRQAQVYIPHEVFGFDPAEIQDRLNINESNFWSTKYRAEDRVDAARRLVAGLSDHPALHDNEPVEDVQFSEFDAIRDRFAGDRAEPREDSREGEQFRGPHGHIVSLTEHLKPEPDGPTGYLVTRWDPETGVVSRRAVSAARVEELIDGGEFTPLADLSVDG